MVIAPASSAPDPTTNPAVNVPFPFMVQVLLTASVGTNVPPRVNEQVRTVPVLVNPPPVMLTIPKPGGAVVGEIAIVPTIVVGSDTFQKNVAPEKKPPE